MHPNYNQKQKKQYGISQFHRFSIQLNDTV